MEALAEIELVTKLLAKLPRGGRIGVWVERQLSNWWVLF